MTYTTTNFKTKKALKDAVKSGARISVFEPGPFPGNTNGTVYLEGPHYPEPHKWYATAVIKDSIIVKVT